LSSRFAAPSLIEPAMPLRDELETGRARWRRLTTYLKFEHAVVLVLTALISIIIVSAIWKLAIKILFTLVLSDTLDLTDLVAFQSVFGMIFTVIIALEFKRTLLLVTEQTDSVVQVRAVILIAMLAIVLLATSELRRAQGRPRPLLADNLAIAIGAAALFVACARPIIG